MGGGNNNMARCYEGIGNDFPLSSIKSWILLVAYLKQKERNELMRCKEIISVHLQVLSITDFNTNVLVWVTYSPVLIRVIPR